MCPLVGLIWSVGLTVCAI